LEATPIIDVEDEGVQKIIGMPGASLRISNVQIPDKKSIELIEYVKPKGKAVDLNTSNPGVAHIAFSVDTIDQMYEDLSKKGVAFVSPPVWAPGNDGKGRWAVCYLRGPDGITLELIERQA
jgi:catechol 2,3-dioxygenase-like lactoylglutathione lyase family enzyme